MAITKEDVFYGQQSPEVLATKLNSLGDTANTGDITTFTTTAKNTVVAAVNELDAEIGALSSLTTTAKNTVVASINEVVTKVAAKAKVKVVAGAAAEADVALGETVSAVTAVLAITTSSGAAAAKLLLAATTDYTVGTNKLTMVSNQSANTLIVFYTVA